MKTKIKNKKSESGTWDEFDSHKHTNIVLTGQLLTSSIFSFTTDFKCGSFYFQTFEKNDFKICCKTVNWTHAILQFQFCVLIFIVFCLRIFSTIWTIKYINFFPLFCSMWPQGSPNNNLMALQRIEDQGFPTDCWP